MAGIFFNNTVDGFKVYPQIVGVENPEINIQDKFSRKLECHQSSLLTDL